MTWKSIFRGCTAGSVLSGLDFGFQAEASKQISLMKWIKGTEPDGAEG